MDAIATQRVDPRSFRMSVGRELNGVIFTNASP